MSRCWFCGGCLALRESFIEPKKMEYRCVNCCRTDDFERECKIKNAKDEFERRCEKQLTQGKHRRGHGITTWGGSDDYRIRRAYK